MNFSETPLKGAYVIDLIRNEDERGYFSRLFCSEKFQNQELEAHFTQINHSMSKMKGTLRGLHYQLYPHEENKIVRCVKGAIYDVILDLRPHSSTFGHHFSIELSDHNPQLLFIPKGFAHGFITLQSHSELIYLVSTSYHKDSERGIRWNDPTFQIQWPMSPHVISDKDNCFPDFDHTYHLNHYL